MPYLVTLKAGLADVALPSGAIAQGGESVVLSDRHYSAIPPATASAVFASVEPTGPTGDPVDDATEETTTAQLNALLASLREAGLLAP